MTKLLHHFIDFKALMEYKDDKHKKIEYWMRAAHREQWDEYFESLFNRALEALEKMPKNRMVLQGLDATRRSMGSLPKQDEHQPLRQF